MEYDPALRQKRARTARKIALLNVKYSPNLGDGIIAECLESELSRLKPEWEVRSIDLAGRMSYGTGLDRSRGVALTVLEHLPSPVRRIVTSIALRTLIRLRYRRVWRDAGSDVDAAIIGGGQLFADADLNFPLKISAALNELQAPSTPVAVFGVGVAGRFSRKGHKLLVEALEDAPIAHVATRDQASSDRWDRSFARSGIPVSEICCDPGLLASQVYPVSSRHESERKTIGIGIVNPATIQLHSGASSSFSRSEALSYWSRLCEDLLGHGYRITLFTNGPQDDESFLSEVLEAVDSEKVARAPKAMSPHDLAQTVSGFDAVIAHRLHASILAYAYCIPHVGLGWDPKIKAFFTSVGREEYAVDPAHTSPARLTDLVAKAIQNGLDEERHTAVMEETRTAIRTCVEDLEAALSDTDESPPY